ncbi:hypothetical protein DFH08DRAFT_1078519 [Mycena albidolilacea]|uniref:Uncharacterized protein n=1 Tax=Mycena albidolilacea TaxID=1033008 RepID=A0AAD7A851_9AGAR|nr:hypothetical protein DFH08DRAFT_1078519 [Mycena albidolilacea]
MQGVALVALLNYDRPKAIPPADWVAALVADSTPLCAYSYEVPAVYTDSKVGSFVGLLVSNTHDLLYDPATSNLMSSSSVMYAAAAGIVEDNLHCIFAASVVDAIARRLCASNAEENTLFGDNAACGASAWAGFSERNRTWERFVKYSRRISRSTSTRVRSIRIATDAWDRLKTDTNSHRLTNHSSFAYIPYPAPEISESVLPELYPTCMASFKAALDADASDEIHAVEGLPADVKTSAAIFTRAELGADAILSHETALAQAANALGAYFCNDINFTNNCTHWTNLVGGNCYTFNASDLHKLSSFGPDQGTYCWLFYVVLASPAGV